MNKAPTFIKHQNRSISGELRLLAEEVRKYRTAGEFVARNVISVDPRRLEPSEPCDGRFSSVSKNPVDIYLDKYTGKMIIEDGHHRVSEAIGRGDQTIPAHITVVETDPEEDALALDVTAEFFHEVRRNLH
jgi:hypothetical protein